MMECRTETTRRHRFFNATLWLLGKSFLGAWRLVFGGGPVITATSATKGTVVVAAKPVAGGASKTQAPNNRDDPIYGVLEGPKVLAALGLAAPLHVVSYSAQVGMRTAA